MYRNIYTLLTGYYFKPISFLYASEPKPFNKPTSMGSPPPGQKWSYMYDLVGKGGGGSEQGRGEGWVEG
jgi:hypothetical protein